ncbi:hypothetical protein Spa11_25210 [Botrimarina mediterranea]|uniref:PEP-CTERM protein-sorting domain-containing protein n=1 Tax=Botrimarina mediterranea TaxID=2528022 RepID=A0A518K951_9BACT|nr:hypothetical protein Spa11_25210 [Botrimarina mediterranea]
MRANAIGFILTAVAGTSYCATAASLVTFQFVAESVSQYSEAFYTVPLGTRVVGTYTFDLDTPGDPPASPVGFTWYDNAIKGATLAMEGFGEATGYGGGTIRIGNPVRTSGSYNFLSDQYVAYFPVAGISLDTRVFGRRNLVGAHIRMADLDMEGIATADLSANPPDLSYFLDNTGPDYDSDNAELYLTFDTANSGYNSNPFRLISLIRVPEPSATALACIAFVATLRNRRRH